MIFEKQILNTYKKMMYSRCDDTETVFYFSPSHFPGLAAEPYSFKSSMGHSLRGYIYSYENPIPKRLVVFDHGFGGGHLAYMKEIEILAKHGYTVFSYDHTGCMESGGEGPNGLSQSLCDLNDCITVIKNDSRFSGFDISVMGHSWGAYSTLNISSLHPEISRVVAMCGFVSVEEMIKTFFSGILKGYRKVVLDYERKTNPVFSDFNAVESLSKSKTQALLIYSDNDKLCRRVHYDILYSHLKDKENVSLMLVGGKGHNPNYTVDAVRLLEDFVAKRGKLLKNKKLTDKEKKDFVSSYDFDKMTAQDESVWDKIFHHLDT